MDIDLPAVETVRLCISDYVNCFVFLINLILSPNLTPIMTFSQDCI